VRAGRFARALRQAEGIAVIAEIKRRSPSAGGLNDAIDAPARAREYVTGGAAAVSVLTEPERFGGDLADLAAVAHATAAPALRKDFIVAELQLDEAVAAGAAAVLLIARALPPARLHALGAAAHARGLGVLAEVRTAQELDAALAISHAVIGVNTRDLETLAVIPEVAERLVPLVPADRIAVFESGIRSRADVERAAECGADAVLVGSALSLAQDPRAAVAALAAVPRRRRR